MNSAEALDLALQVWKDQGKSKAEIVVLQCEFMLGWPYVWGASGQNCTSEKRRYFMNRDVCPEGDKELIRKRCQILNGSKTTCIGCKYYPNGMTRIQDCQGFDKEVFKAVGITLSGGGATTMYNNNTNWQLKGKIANMPDQVCCVFKYDSGSGRMEHTGIHIGGGKIIHCSGEVKRGNTSERGWTHFGVPKGMEGDVPVPTPTPEDRPTLRQGSSGPWVVKCQEDLIRLNYNLSPYGADGKYGKKTAAAVTEFQKDNPPLKADGICGPATWGVLIEKAEKDPQPVPDTYSVIIHGLDKTQAEAISANYPGSEIVPEGSDQK